MDPHADIRVKNKLEKQDEIEMSDEEELSGASGSGASTDRRRSKSKKGSSAPQSHKIHGDKLTKQTSGPAMLERTQPDGSLPTNFEVDRQNRKASFPLAHVQLTEGAEFHLRKNELTAPKHLGSLAFSSMSTEENSSICDTDVLGRQMGLLSLQGSLQADESYAGGERNSEEFSTTAEFLLSTWHRNRRDRAFLLEFEQLLEDMLNAKDDTQVVTQPLNSYHRMLLHRLAEVWGFQHLPMGMGAAQRKDFPFPISLKATTESRKPDQLFRDMLEKVPDEPGKSILKRPKNHSLPETNLIPAPARVVATKSLEERQAHYDQVRERIFNSDNDSTDGGETLRNYGTEQRYGSPGDTTPQGTYDRSRSVISDVSSEQSFDPSQNRMTYSPYAGRPMGNPQVMYGGQGYGYPNPSMMGYPPPGNSLMDPATAYQQMYLGQQQYYPGYENAQFIPQQVPYGANMQFAHQGYPPQHVYPAQGPLDPMMQMYDQPGQYMNQHFYQNAGMDVSGISMHPGMPQPVDQSGGMSYGPPYELPMQYQPQLGPSTDPRFGPPLIQQHPMSHHPAAYMGGGGVADVSQQQQQQQRTQINDSVIIPLRFPSVGPPSTPFEMFLKIPCLRGATGIPSSAGGSVYGGGAVGEDGVARLSRQNSSSGRSSIDRQNSAASPGSGAGKSEATVTPPGSDELTKGGMTRS